jgi:2-polyprenyl-6-methoxyphenol hydroxylase-like FAD-dependent oxidoreductase
MRNPSTCVLHPADLQRVLYDAAVRAGASIIFGKNVTELDVDEPGLTFEFEDGSAATGDLIVGADGMSSFPLLSCCIHRDIPRRKVS